MSRLPLLTFVLAVFSAGCTSDSDPDDGVTRPTLVEVDPAEFVSCEVTDPTWDQKRYVSTLCDVTETSPGQTPVGFALPSSPPVACYQPVTFSYVTPGRKYIARVDEYDGQNVEAVIVGDRWMKRTGSDPVELLEPSRIFTCNNSVLALNTLTRPVRGCVPSVTLAEAPGTHVKIASAPVAPVNCPGEVASYKIIGSGVDQTATSSGENSMAVDPNTTCVNLAFVAYANDGQTPRWTAHCYAIAVENTTVNATCAPARCNSTN